MYKETWLEKHGFKLVFGAIFAFFFMIAIIIFTAVQYHDRLFEQCMQDGKKEYECFALIYRGNR